MDLFDLMLCGADLAVFESWPTDRLTKWIEIMRVKQELGLLIHVGLRPSEAGDAREPIRLGGTRAPAG